MRYSNILIVLMVCGFLFGGSSTVSAQGGMWLPSLLGELNESDMKSKGLQLSADDIYSINQSSLKDAIVHFGGGCTAEVISDEGLILTNHHCGYGEIQSHSSVDNDYLKNGFWAMSRSEELPNAGLTATFLIRMEDVTEKVLVGVTDDMAKDTRDGIIKVNIDKVVAEVEKEGYGATVKAFYYGNEYYMFVTETYRDVRLVGAPPSSIGQFGQDTDNWVWPRHSGDFSLFRIYAGSDNKPADYSPSNRPYKPKASLPISLGGVNEGDFTMVYGFPGRTQQYLPSYAVESVLEVVNPTRIKVRETSLDIIGTAMQESDEIRIQYAAKQARISNYHKKWIGESWGLKRMRAIDKKREFEAEFMKLAAQKGTGGYDKLLPQFKRLYGGITEYSRSKAYYEELMFYGADFFYLAFNMVRLIDNYESYQEGGRLEGMLKRYDRFVQRIYKDNHQPTDKKLMKSMLQLYMKGVDKGQQADILPLMEKKYKGNWEAYVDMVYALSAFSTEKKAKAVLGNLNASAIKKIKKDPGYMLTKSLMEAYETKTKPEYDRMNNEIQDLLRTYVKAMRELMPDKRFWPDANSTLRLTYGKVDGSEPRDAVTYKHYTVLEGVRAKYIPGDREFDLPPKLLQLLEDGDYGQYADPKDGLLHVNFTASNHTTGGNSGSPVINADGELIGLNFDRSWESTMSDIMYNPDICRNIAVDARYILFIIDKFAGASHLIKEMKLVDVPGKAAPKSDGQMKPNKAKE